MSFIKYKSDYIKLIDQNGGGSAQVLIACSIPYQESTFINNIGKILRTFNKLYPNKNYDLHFINFVSNDYELKNRMPVNLDKYPRFNNVYLNTKITIVNYLKDQNIKKPLFDIILFAQCNNLLSLFTTSGVEAKETELKEVYSNIDLLHKSLNSGGKLIVGWYVNTSNKLNIEEDNDYVNDKKMYQDAIDKIQKSQEIIYSEINELIYSFRKFESKLHNIFSEITSNKYYQLYLTKLREKNENLESTKNITSNNLIKIKDNIELLNDNKDIKDNFRKSNNEIVASFYRYLNRLEYDNFENMVVENTNNVRDINIIKNIVGYIEKLFVNVEKGIYIKK